MDWRPLPHARIAVLAGGDSAEREISLASGRSVAAALATAGYDVHVFDPALCELADIAWGEFDACFIALHGGAGENGRLQRRLDLLKVSYTGSGPAACRLAMSKSASKERFLQAGVPTLPYLLFPSDISVDELANGLARLSYPVVIKPDSQGSSLGVSVARSRDDLEECLKVCRPLDNYALAEPLVSGREFTVAVLGRCALPLLEIVTLCGLFNYNAKYRDECTELRFDTGLPDPQVAELERIAVAAAACLGTRGLCRVDLMLDDEGRAWILEVNAVPGMTEHSLAPLAARQAGLEMPQLCDLLLQQCLAVEASR
jgi:D-alanine-D-alanine ligase